MNPSTKSVLLYAANENERSILSFVFRTKGFLVHAGLSRFPPIPDVAFVVDDRMQSVTVGNAIAEMVPRIPMVVIIPDLAQVPEGYPVDAQFLPQGTPVALIVERIKLILARKRNTRKRVAVMEDLWQKSTISR